jgi:hypothetical protein
MHDPEKSDSGIVVAKPTKKPGDRAKSSEQGRPRAEMQAEPSWVAASVPRRYCRDGSRSARGANRTWLSTVYHLTFIDPRTIDVSQNSHANSTI